MLSINISEVIWTIVNFLLLMFLLKKFLYTPIINFMDERDARINAAAKVKSDAETEKSRCEDDNAAQLEESRNEARRIVSVSKTENDKSRTEFIKKANAKELENRKEMKLTIAKEKEALSKELENSEAELAALLAERLISEER